MMPAHHKPAIVGRMRSLPKNIMAKFTQSPKLSNRYNRALGFMFDAHQFQIRKQGEVSYIAHLMSVSSLVLEANGSENEAIAALLHDYVEDINQETGFDVIRDTFGAEVSSIVRKLTAETNAEYVQNISHVRISAVLLVSCADKLHNLRSYATDGKHLWKPVHAEFYAQLMPIFEECDRIPRYWLAEMKALLAGMDQPGMDQQSITIPMGEYERLQFLASEGMEWDREFRDPGDRPCQCGSSQPVMSCSENSQYCG